MVYSLLKFNLLLLDLPRSDAHDRVLFGQVQANTPNVGRGNKENTPFLSVYEKN